MFDDPGMRLDAFLVAAFLFFSLLRNGLSTRVAGVDISFGRCALNSLKLLGICVLSVPFLIGLLAFIATTHLLDFLNNIKGATVLAPDTLGSQITLFVLFSINTLPSYFHEKKIIGKAGGSGGRAGMASIFSGIYFVLLCNLLVFLMYSVAMKYF